MGTDTLKQLHLFNVEEDRDTVDVATHKCKECGEAKPIRSFNTKNIIPPQKKEGSFYPVRRQTHEGDVQLFALFNTCRECDAKGRAGRHARERMYSKPSIVSPKLPSPVLQFLHNQPLNSPVLWSWSICQALFKSYFLL